MYAFGMGRARGCGVGGVGQGWCMIGASGKKPGWERGTAGKEARLGKKEVPSVVHSARRGFHGAARDVRIERVG